MKTLIISLILLGTTTAFGSSHSDVLSFRNYESKEFTPIDLSNMQKPEAEEELPVYVMKNTEKSKVTVNEHTFCVISQIRKPEIEEELPAFMM